MKLETLCKETFFPDIISHLTIEHYFLWRNNDYYY